MSKIFKVAYDAGHGINTAGKRSPDGEREWSFNNKVIVSFEKEMKKYQNVELLRTDDPSGKTDVPLRTRTNKANSWGADIYLSSHHNAYQSKWGEHTGTEVFYSKGSVNGEKLAKLILEGQLEAYGLRDRGLKTNNLHITRETRMPAVLIEGGFMDSTIDIKKLRDDKVLEQAGVNAARSVAEYGGLKLKGGQSSGSSKPTAPKPNPSPSKPAKKSNAEIAKEVMAGKWGNNPKRKNDLIKAGYDYNAIQAEVNKLVGAKSSKPIVPSTTIVDEVIAGKWGNGNDRTNRLKKAGYNPSTIQKEVNRKLGAKPKPKKTNKQIAQEIYRGQGNWGTGKTRQDRLRKAGYDPVAVQREVNKLF